jgi:hypothetical protein
MFPVSTLVSFESGTSEDSAPEVLSTFRSELRTDETVNCQAYFSFTVNNFEAKPVSDSSGAGQFRNLLSPIRSEE